MRLVAGTIYVLAMSLAVYVIFSFYVGYYGQIADLFSR